jgi:hypothetical protein
MIKGVIEPEHIAVNKYELAVIGLPPLTPTSIGGLEQELETVTLPDRTVASGGNTKALETTIAIPAHHRVEIAAMEKWCIDGEDPVAPDYKKAATLIMKRISIKDGLAFSLTGVFAKKKKTPDLEMSNEGDMAVIEYTLSIDSIELIG